MLTQFFILGAGAMVVIGPSLGYWGPRTYEFCPAAICIIPVMVFVILLLFSSLFLISGDRKIISFTDNVSCLIGK